MQNTQNLLENHVIYGLNKAICDYLAPVLEQKLGEPFQTWRIKEQVQFERDAEATRVHGKTMVGKPIELQEELLAYADGAGSLRQVWLDLIGTAAWLEWKELGMIYSLAKYDLRDMELMAVARQAAENSGDEVHAARVREIMALEEIQSLNWWSLEQGA